MGFTKFTKNVLNVSALPDRVQNQASSLKLVFDQAGVDIKAALNALISELEAKVAAANIGADVASVTEKTVQAILTAFENEIANRYTKEETNNVVLADTNELIADVKIDLATGLLTVTKKNGTKQTFETSTEAESYAVGGTGTRPGEDTDNAKYYAQIAKQVAGGDFVTVVEMEGYAQKKGVYPNYDETKLKGEVIETETTLEAESVLKVSGNSVQETRSGKNKLKIVNSGDSLQYNSETNELTLKSGFVKSALPIIEMNLPANKTYLFEVFLISSLSSSQKVQFIPKKADGSAMFSQPFTFTNSSTYYSYSYTPAEDIVSTQLQIYVGTALTEDVIFKIQMRENTTPEGYEPYGVMPSPEFESPIISVSGDVEVKVEGKNLFDMGACTDGYATGMGGDLYLEPNYSVSDFIKIEPNTTYAFVGFKWFNFYNSDKVNVSRIAGTNISNFITPENAQYLRGSLRTVDKSIAQLENGTIPTQVVPYVEPNVVDMPLGDIELRSTPDGTRDTFVRVDGAWNYRAGAGSVIFDGVNNKFESKSGSTANTIWMSPAKYEVENKVIVMCNRFNGNSGNLYDRDGIGIYAENKRLKVAFGLNSELTTLELANNWLVNNPLYVIYPTTTPTYTPITDQALISALDKLEQLVLHKGYNRITVTGVNGVKAQLELEIAPTALLTNISETEAGLNMPVPVVSEAGDVLVKVPKAENQMTINPATGVVNVKGLSINGVSLDAYIRSIIG